MTTLKQMTMAIAMLTLSLGTSCGSNAVQTGLGSPTDEAVFMEVRLSTGEFINVGSMQGQKSLLFVFATFDEVSQVAATTLAFVVKRHPELHVLALASQPNARMFVDAWAYAFTPPYSVGHVPNHDLRKGSTSLGVVDAVPTFILLDEAGREMRRAVGLVTESAIERFVEGH